MNYVIILFGLLVAALSLILLFRPKASMNYFHEHAGSLWLYISAVFVRIGMGIVLILYADQSRYPEAFEIIGYLVLVAGVILGLIGRNRFEKLVGWAMGLFGKMSWFSGLLGLVFGLFFVHAVT